MEKNVRDFFSQIKRDIDKQQEYNILFIARKPSRSHVENVQIFKKPTTHCLWKYYMFRSLKNKFVKYEKYEKYDRDDKKFPQFSR